ncbi:MAG: molybdenum cofactor biosynthesis protein MoaE [Epsilonproteobacteria bacterium]|nr:molybdenum cofactor biosynthesis protein MoaE [Campylobacterota bacterium]
MVEVFKGGIPVIDTLNRWYEEFKLEGYGAMIPFIGIVRADNNIEALSFDLYLPMLNKWFEKWQNLPDAKIVMAHSFSDVKVGETSFLCAVFTKHRKEGFEYIEKFVEDFKANAPIWKYDVINGKRLFAKDRAKKLQYAGILSERVSK